VSETNAASWYREAVPGDRPVERVDRSVLVRLPDDVVPPVETAESLVESENAGARRQRAGRFAHDRLWRINALLSKFVAANILAY